MKQEITSRDNLTILSKYIISAFDSSENRKKGSIQFDLKHSGENIFCYFVSDGKKLAFDFGEIKDYDVKLTSSLYDWLESCK